MAGDGGWQQQDQRGLRHRSNNNDRRSGDSGSGRSGGDGRGYHDDLRSGDSGRSGDGRGYHDDRRGRSGSGNYEGRGGGNDSRERSGSSGYYEGRRGGNDSRERSGSSGYYEGRGGGNDNRERSGSGQYDYNSSRRGSGVSYDNSSSYDRNQQRGSDGGGRSDGNGYHDDRRGSGGPYPSNNRARAESYSDNRGQGSHGISSGGNGRTGGGGSGHQQQQQHHQGYHQGGGRGGGGGGGGYRGVGRGGGDGRNSYSGGRGRGGGGGRGRGGPDMSGMTSCLSNVMQADVAENFQFFLYSVAAEDFNGDQVESRHRRKFLFDLGLWNGVLKEMPDKQKEDLRRVVFFQGSFFYSARRIPELEPDNLPMNLPLTDEAEGDTIKIMQVVHYTTPIELKTKESTSTKVGEVSFDKRCNDCAKCFTDVGALLQHCQQAGHTPVYSPDDTAVIGCKPIPANMEVFNSYVNGALQRALGERLARWGTEYIDPHNMEEPIDKQGRSLGVRVYEAYSCQFGFIRNSSNDIPRVGLTVDLRAKIVRTMSVLDNLSKGNPRYYSPAPRDQDEARRHWIGEVVISMHDKKCYSVTDLMYNHSAQTLPVEGLGMTHAEYFASRKNITLKYPNAKPMIAVLGRRNQTIFLPPELVAGNELEARVKQQLPMIASYKPDSRNQAIDKIRAYLIPASGTLIHGIQGIDYDTFYINGRAPHYSTPKPVRFIVVKKDEGLNKVPIEELTWDLSHDYPNWTGPIKVPSVCQMAHKLAELGGSFADCGNSIDAVKLKNTIHFL